jgi:lipid-binding SYLF domain-containing protein
MGALVDIMEDPYNNNNNPIRADIQQCKDTCSTISPNLNDLDGVQIPARLLEMAKGVAILTVIKGGFGFAGVEFGTGLVVARLPNIPIPTPISPTSTADNGTTTNYVPNIGSSANFRWSAPSAIGTAGVSWGALLGAQVSDHVFLLMSDEAVALLYNNKASIQLGADIGIAIGPLGRTLEGDLGVDGKNNKIAPIYTYSMSKGLYAGVSLDGKVIVTRPDVNEKFYGMSISAEEILAGVVPTPPAAQPLYEALHRCHVYATMAERKVQSSRRLPNQPIMTNFSQQHLQYTPTGTISTTSSNAMMDESSYMAEYGEHQS